MERLRDLQDDYIIIVGKTSITIKDRQSKTRGVIRCIETWGSMQFNRQVDWHVKFMRQGLNIKDIAKDLIFSGKDVYYLFNKRKYALIEEIDNEYKNREDFDVRSERKTLEQMNHIVDLCNKYGIEVLRVNM